MKVLLVEDEEHKRTELAEFLAGEGIGKNDITVAAGVREAVLSVITTEYDLIVLDMALPTFSKTDKEESDGGFAQAVGGVEVLRALSSVEKMSSIIIVTQYPDIILNGEKIRLEKAPKIISKKYKQNVLGAVLYSFKSPTWQKIFSNYLRSLK